MIGRVDQRDGVRMAGDRPAQHVVERRAAGAARRRHLLG